MDLKPGEPQPCARWIGLEQCQERSNCVRNSCCAAVKVKPSGRSYDPRTPTQ